MSTRSPAPRVVPAAALLAALMAGGRVTAQAPSARADGQPPVCRQTATRVNGTVERLGGGGVAGAQVTIGWNVLELRGMEVRTVRCQVEVASAADGRWQADSVPADESLVLTAATAQGEAGVAVRAAVAAPMPPVTVYLPSTADLAAAAAAGPACRTRGRVVGPTGIPVAQAAVRVERGGTIRTDEQGAFDAPQCGKDGTAFDVRGLAVARADVWVRVDPAPRAWVLSLDRAIPKLDAVVVKAPRIEFTDATGFEQRRRQGMGRFVTRADIVRRNPSNLVWMFEGMPGVTVTGNRVTITRNLGRPCPAATYLDGMYVPLFDLSMIDPQSVYGIEVYRGPADTPMQFQQGRSGAACGAIAVWTRRGLEP